MSSCNANPNDPSESSFVLFTKNLGKIFTIMTALALVFVMKNKLMGPAASAFSIALFVVVSTLIISVIGISDTYVLSNILMGLGLGLGISIFSPAGAASMAPAALVSQ